MHIYSLQMMKLQMKWDTLYKERGLENVASKNVLMACSSMGAQPSIS